MAKKFSYKYNFGRYDVYGPNGYVGYADTSKEAEEFAEELELEMEKKPKLEPKD